MRFNHEIDKERDAERQINVDRWGERVRDNYREGERYIKEV